MHVLQHSSAASNHKDGSACAPRWRPLACHLSPLSRPSRSLSRSPGLSRGHRHCQSVLPCRRSKTCACVCVHMYQGAKDRCVSAGLRAHAHMPVQHWSPSDNFVPRRQRSHSLVSKLWLPGLQALVEKTGPSIVERVVHLHNSKRGAAALNISAVA